MSHRILAIYIFFGQDFLERLFELTYQENHQLRGWLKLAFIFKENAFFGCFVVFFIVSQHLPNPKYCNLWVFPLRNSVPLKSVAISMAWSHFGKVHLLTGTRSNFMSNEIHCFQKHQQIYYDISSFRCWMENHWDLFLAFLLITSSNLNLDPGISLCFMNWNTTRVFFCCCILCESGLMVNGAALV